MSKLVTTPVSRGVVLRKSVLGMAVAAALALPQVAAAMDFDLGSDNLTFRWDNTLRVNIQDRVAGMDHHMIANPNYDDGDRNFTPGSIFTRFDVLSEMDLVWKPSWGTLGARVSAAGWWDPGYQSLDNDSIQTANNLKDGYPTLDLSKTTKRYGEGPSGEFLDWFLFTGFMVGNAPVNIKVGQTTVYYGESIFNFGNSISYAQNPIDVWKAYNNPGTEAKELFRPRVGFNINSQVTDTLNVAAQYFFNWQDFSNQAYRYMENGTFLDLSDAMMWGSASIISGLNPVYGYPQFPPPPFPIQTSYPLCYGAPLSPPVDIGETWPTCAPEQYSRLWRTKDSTPDENSGNWGLALRWNPDWAAGTIGVYYRRTYDMQPQVVVAPDVIPGIPAPFVVTPPPPASPYVVNYCASVLAGSYLGHNNCLQNTADNFANFVNKGRVGTYNLAFGSDIDIYGLSYSRNIGGLSVSGELSYRTNMPLLSDPVAVLPSALRDVLHVPLPSGSIWSDKVPKNDTPGAKGDTMHAVLDVIGVLGDSIWDTASWTFELNWMTWLNVTQNEAVFKGRSDHHPTYPLPLGGVCQPGPTDSWCAYTLLDKVDKNYFGVNFNFTPTWFQVKPGMDVLMPISWSQGISGNSALTGVGQEGAGTFGLGIALDFYQKYRFDLKYVAFYGDYQKCKSVPNKFSSSTGYSSRVGTCNVDSATGATYNPGDAAVFNGTAAVLSDRDFISLTFKTTF